MQNKYEQELGREREEEKGNGESLRRRDVSNPRGMDRENREEKEEEKMGSDGSILESDVGLENRPNNLNARDALNEREKRIK